MALETVLSNLDGIDDAIKGLYKEDNGLFVLDISGVDNHPSVRGLKSAFEATKQDKLTAKEKLEKFEADKAEADRKAAEEKGEFKTLFESTQAELEKTRTESALFRKKIADKDISLELMRMAAEVTADVKKQEVIVDLYKRYAEVTEDGVSFSVGGVAFDNKKIVEMIKNDTPFLVDGSKAGGGGSGGGGGGAPVKAWGDMTEIEKTELYKADIDAYRASKAAANK